MNQPATGEEWRRNRQTHRWVTLNGEDYACDICDTKTGSQPCPRDIIEEGPWLDQVGWDGYSEEEGT